MQNAFCMKKLLGILLPVLALLGVALWPRSTRPAPTTHPAATVEVSSTSTSHPSAPLADPAAPTAVAHPAPAAPVSPTATAAASPAPAPAPVAPTEAPAKPAVSLNELYRTFDAIETAGNAKTPQSLATLVGYAASDNADIRTAALNALIRRDEPGASKLLRAAAKKSDTSETIIALLQTADYLELPPKTLGEITATPKPPGSIGNPRPPALK